MEKLLMNIIANMEKEKELYEELLQLSQRKKDIIFEQKVQELDKIVGAEEKFILETGKLKKEREEFIHQLAILKNIDPDDITLSTLIELSNGESRARLEQVGREFNQIIDRQKRLNEVNAKLLKTNLEYVDFALQVMTGLNASGTMYEKEGQASQGKQSRGLFDQKA